MQENIEKIDFYAQYNIIIELSLFAKCLEIKCLQNTYLMECTCLKEIHFINGAAHHTAPKCR